METRSCINCRHWVSNHCRASSPIASDGGAGVWPETAVTDWCGQFNPTTRERGQPPKISDQQVVDLVKVYDSTTDSDGNPAERMALKRTELVYGLTQLGITQTPALKRIEKLVRHGILEIGENPWPRKYPTPGIYVWLGREMAAQEPGKEADKFLPLIRQVAPDLQSAASIRSIVREIHHTLPMSVATAARKMAKLVEAGLVEKCLDGYYAAPQKGGGS